MNLIEILKEVPIGTKFYSPLFTDVVFMGIYLNFDGLYAIKIEVINEQEIEYLTSDGKLPPYEYGECMLFPSKENRDWSTYKSPVRKDLPELTSCICFDELINGKPQFPHVCLYAGSGEVYDSYYDENRDIITYNFIIPKDKFNFDTFEFNNDDNYGNITN